VSSEILARRRQLELQILDELMALDSEGLIVTTEIGSASGSQWKKFNAATCLCAIVEIKTRLRNIEKMRKEYENLGTLLTM
jgi:hypothetical protein